VGEVERGEADERRADESHGERVAIEVVRTLAGSIGLVASVPFTTAIAAIVVTRDPAGVAPAGEGQRRPGRRRPRGAPEAQQPPAAGNDGPYDDEAGSGTSAPPAGEAADPPDGVEEPGGSRRRRDERREARRSTDPRVGRSRREQRFWKDV
jgi:hypothetical protein